MIKKGEIAIANLCLVSIVCSMNSLMGSFKILFGSRKLKHHGVGLPQGFIFEIRFLLAGILLLTLVLASWFWMQKNERESYASQALQKIETAAGYPKIHL